MSLVDEMKKDLQKHKVARQDLDHKIQELNKRTDAEVNRIATQIEGGLTAVKSILMKRFIPIPTSISLDLSDPRHRKVMRTVADMLDEIDEQDKLEVVEGDIGEENVLAGR